MKVINTFRLVRKNIYINKSIACINLYLAEVLIFEYCVVQVSNWKLYFLATRKRFILTIQVQILRYLRNRDSMKEAFTVQEIIGELFPFSFSFFLLMTMYQKS